MIDCKVSFSEANLKKWNTFSDSRRFETATVIRYESPFVWTVEFPTLQPGQTVVMTVTAAMVDGTLAGGRTTGIVGNTTLFSITDH